MNPLVDPAILAAIGRNLISLHLLGQSKELVDGIVDYCPNLQYLELDVEIDEEVNEALMGLLKNGLKKLAKLKVNWDSERLGTDWEGYIKEEYDEPEDDE
jgi:hypothetical protein